MSLWNKSTDKVYVLFPLLVRIPFIRKKVLLLCLKCHQHRLLILLFKPWKSPWEGITASHTKYILSLFPEVALFVFPLFLDFVLKKIKKKNFAYLYFVGKIISICIFGRLFFFLGNYFTSERALFHYFSMNNEKDFRKSFPFSSVPAPASFPTHICIDYMNTGQRVSVDIVRLSFLASESLRLQNDNHCCL